MGFYVISIIGIIVGLAVVGTIGYVVFRVRKFSQDVFGTPDIAEGFRRQEIQYEEKPKTVSGMTRFEVPKIERDFPEFHWPEWKQICEETLRKYLEAIEHQNLSYLRDASEELRDQVQSIIVENGELGIQEAFDQLKVHQTEIFRYEKNPATCKIKVQSSVQYYHTRISPDKRKNVENKKEQHRYDIELIYVQDFSRFDQVTNMYHVTCPNCGAPITNLGNKVCESCGTAVEILNTKVWVLNRIDRAD